MEGSHPRESGGKGSVDCESLSSFQRNGAVPACKIGCLFDISTEHPTPAVLVDLLIIDPLNDIGLAYGGCPRSAVTCIGWG
jgi:hypothetical protein